MQKLSFLVAIAALAACTGKDTANAQVHPVAKTTPVAGVRARPDALCEIGTTYRLGIGANQVNFRVDAVELAEEFTHQDMAGKPQTEKSDSIHAWVVVRFTAQNVGAKKLPIWEETWGGNGSPRTPFLQMNAVRQWGDTSETGQDFFELYNKDFYRASDGKILDTNGPSDKPNWLQPGQTMKAFAAFQIRKEASPIATHIDVNYFGLPGGGGVGVGDPHSVDASSKSTLMRFDIKKAIGE